MVSTDTPDAAWGAPGDRLESYNQSHRMDTVLKLLDDAFGSIAGKPRWVVEVSLLVMAGIAIHFSYSVLSVRHDRIIKEAQDKTATPQSTITVGPVTTYGPQSGVTIGGAPDNKPKEGPHK